MTPSFSVGTLFNDRSGWFPRLPAAFSPTGGGKKKPVSKGIPGSEMSIARSPALFQEVNMMFSNTRCKCGLKLSSPEASCANLALFAARGIVETLLTDVREPEPAPGARAWLVGEHHVGTIRNLHRRMGVGLGKRRVVLQTHGRIGMELFEAGG